MYNKFEGLRGIRCTHIFAPTDDIFLLSFRFWFASVCPGGAIPAQDMKSAILTFSIYKLCSDYNTFAESWSMIIMNFDDELKR